MSYKGLVFAAAVLAVACASTAANADYYYSGYDYGSRTWNSGYGNIRPSFWGYPALLLRGDQTKVIATADEIEAVREYREYQERYAYGRYYGGDYDGYSEGPGLLGLPGALLSGLFGAADGAFRGAAYGADYYSGPEYGYYSARGYDSGYYGHSYYGRPRYEPAYEGRGYFSRPRYDPPYDGPRYDSGPRYGSAYYGEPGGDAAYYRGSYSYSYSGGGDYGSGWGD
jgi:hypothetical protein